MNTYCKPIKPSVLGHFLTDDIGSSCGHFTFVEKDLILLCSREINMNDQPSQIMVNHPKIPGLSWVIFFYKTVPNQYQPRVAFDFPSYLRADCEMCIQLAGMNWLIKHKFEGSSWLTSSLPPKAMNDRWCTAGATKQVDVKVTITKIWFKFPLFTCCCHPVQTKKCVRQPDFLSPEALSDVQLLPNDEAHRRLFVHSSILAMNSPILYDRIKNMKSLNQGDAASVISMPFGFNQVHDYVQIIYPNSAMEINRENVEDLMEISKEYQTTSVIRRCEKYLYKELECGSAVIVYYLSRKYELHGLQMAALLHLAELNACQLQARINLDMKNKSPAAQENLLNELSERLGNASLC